MKRLTIADLEIILAGEDGNCGGIYNSCLNAAAFAGCAAVLATAGWGIIFSVLGASAAMEYCRQQYIGCQH